MHGGVPPPLKPTKARTHFQAHFGAHFHALIQASKNLWVLGHTDDEGAAGGVLGEQQRTHCTAQHTNNCLEQVRHTGPHINQKCFSE
jgi:hypothetical protein